MRPSERNWGFTGPKRYAFWTIWSRKVG